MKKTILSTAVALFVAAASVNAQSTVDSIASKYQLIPMPDSFRIEKAFPVLGTYQLMDATDAAATLTVSLDANSKGIVWVEGLPQGKIKAYLKKSPATYRILPQKSESGTQVPAGTLVFDTTSNTLNIALGKAYNEADPTAVFGGLTSTTEEGTTATTTKASAAKTKGTAVKIYTATKVNEGLTNATSTSINSATNNAGTTTNNSMNNQ